MDVEQASFHEITNQEWRFDIIALSEAIYRQNTRMAVSKTDAGLLSFSPTRRSTLHSGLLALETVAQCCLRLDCYSLK